MKSFKSKFKIFDKSIFLIINIKLSINNIDIVCITINIFLNQSIL